MQTDYLFMCWFGGCFCPSCHTSISNVKGPHLGCVKMHHVETEKKSSLRSQAESFRGSKFSVSFSCKLFGIASRIWTKLEKGMCFFILSSTSLCCVCVWREKNCVCSEQRWEVMCDGGRAKARKAKQKDRQCFFICLGVGCKQTQSLCKLLISWTVKSSRWKQEN